MIYFFIIVTLGYLLLHIFFLVGYIKSKNSLKSDHTENIPVTVIVAAKNEENTIQLCIDSLKSINYPESLLEVIIVNDKSSDNTGEVVLKSIDGYKNFKLIESSDNQDNGIKGKANALDTGINIASGEIIFTTDADCSVSPDWINETLKYYSDSSIVMVCGFTNIRKSSGIFSKLQSLDWIYLLSLASCSSGLHKIMSCIGNNLTFRTSIYKKLGGYRNIKFSITEDLALMRKIDSIKSYKIAFPVDYRCSVTTSACNTLREFYLQKKRWFKGGVGINWLGYVTGFEMYLMNLILFPGFIFISPLNYSILIIIKIISELLIFLPAYKDLRIEKTFRYFPLFQIFFGIYGLLLPVSFLFGFKIDWKGKKY